MNPESVRQATGAAIRELRKRAKISQDQMGISRAQLSLIEQGKSLPNIWTLAVIARSLRLSLPQLVSEIDRRRKLPSLEASETRMLDGGILLVVRAGHLDASKTPQFQAEFLENVKRHQAKKVLLDFAGVECDFSQEEQYDSVMDLLRLLRKAGCYPLAMAGVGNSTIDGFGVRVMDGHGCPSRLFKSREEAMQWLRATNLRSLA